MKILFIHQNFPAQFLHLAGDLARRGHQVVALCRNARAAPDGVALRTYQFLRPPMPEIHPLLAEQESQVRHAEACAAAAMQLQREGFTPDIVLAHPGWGEALFIKDVFPQAKLLLYCEYYYALEGQDVGFDPGLPPLSMPERWRLRLRNSTNLLSMELADAAIAPTRWQRDTYPAWARDKITVIHDGIDSERLRFNPEARLALPGVAARFAPGDEVISFVARNLEPMRGFDVFMRALPDVLRRRPDAHAIVVGGDEVGYGYPAPGGRSWKEHMLAEVGARLDGARVHFAGQLAPREYLDLLSISRVHAYWSAPFVLSWSFLEAALSGVPVLASATAPVLEFSAALGVACVPFFDAAAWADAIALRCADGARPRQAPPPLPELTLENCLARQRQWLAAALAT
ncbi:glycosyltransferase [Massilia antarctica]|uniref:glycosyltransferase n=1 Tax=Massilia antarctica TaxID=2765360 RepID=UPI0006BB5D3E|nr:glycosyltransferase [Massilia sp. H27-R4]MCY0915579.1 glycosyltransferase [Massilia sp. H27-R4]CUI04069.1 Probable glycosyltransferase [Janthinobacterium sp. CG23_2]CUU27855.1 Probable glycosyltransferase [Janthinobacterium sp. CG23_2]